jgi:exonuclease III
MTININSIRGKKLELQTLLDTSKPHIVAIQETKIDNSISSDEIIPQDLEYDVYRNDRTIGGGGVMLLIKKELHSMPLQSLEMRTESCWASLELKGQKHYFSSWYRAPDAPADEILKLNDQINNIRSKHKKTHNLTFTY